jgi:DUF1680 family protein
VSLRLRIPGWAREGHVTVTAQGRTVPASPGTYFEIRQTWAPNEVVELDLDFGASLWEANPLVEDTLNQVAVRYGPLIYCLESNDLPDGVRLEDVALSSEVARTAFVPQRETIANADVLVLAAPALVVARVKAQAGALYSEADVNPPREIKVKLVPYLAWGNRGDTDMTVWIPVR